MDIPKTVIDAITHGTAAPAKVRAELVKPKPATNGFHVEESSTDVPREFAGTISLEKGEAPPPMEPRKRKGPRKDHGGRSAGPILDALRKMKPPVDGVYSTFVVPVGEDPKERHRMRGNINNKIATDRKKYGSKAKYTTRIVKEGIRVWRIA